MDTRTYEPPKALGGVELKRQVTEFEGSGALPYWWHDLFERAESASIFLSPAWVQTWLEVYGHEFSGSWLRWESRGETVGGCLILRRTVWRKRWPLPTLFINTAGETSQRSPPMEFNEVLHLAGYQDAVATDLARVIAAQRWTRLELSGYEDSALARSLMAHLPVCSIDRAERPAPYVDFGAIAGHDYEATLSSNTRSQIRRCRRVYEERHGPVVIEAASDCNQAMSFLTELAALHNATWSSRGLAGAFVSKAFDEFHRRLIRRLWSLRCVDVLCVRAGNKVIGYAYNFLHRGKVYSFQTGLVHEQDKRLKPGMLTHASAIRHYCDNGYREYDFLAGDMRYKRSLAKSQRTLVWSVAYRRSTQMRLLLLARTARRHLSPSRLARSPELETA